MLAQTCRGEHRSSAIRDHPPNAQSVGGDVLDAPLQRAKKKGAIFDDVKAGILNYLDYIKAKKIEPQFIKQGSTWFNGECWNDEYDYSVPEGTPAQQASSNPFLDILRNGD